MGGHFRRGPGDPGPGGEGGDGQHHGRVRPGRRWWPRQVEEGLVREGHSEGDVGPVKKSRSQAAEVLEQLQ